MFFRDETYRAAVVCLIFNRFYRICRGGVGVVSWGRKDGFPGADGSTIQSNGAANAIPIYTADGTITQVSTLGVSSAINGLPNTLIYTIKQPLAFIWSSVTDFYIADWYTHGTNHNDALWGTETSQKGLYDPCPSGWVVSPNGTWNDMVLGNSPWSGNRIAAGRLYNRLAWYPATGNYAYNSGRVQYVGIYGSYFSIHVSGASAWILSLSSTYVTPSLARGRAYGYSVRCIQE